MDEVVLLRHRKIEITRYASVYAIVVRSGNATLADRVNRALDNYYPKSITSGDEPIFYVGKDGLRKVAGVLTPSMSKIVLSQLCP
jgi:hypothetical protein